MKLKKLFQNREFDGNELETILINILSGITVMCIVAVPIILCLFWPVLVEVIVGILLLVSLIGYGIWTIFERVFPKRYE